MGKPRGTGALQEVVASRRLGNVEIIRFAAAALVVFFHLHQRYENDFGLLPELNSAMGVFGSGGVDIFFVISGFVIGMNIANRNVTSKTFLTARVSRIVPTYWLLTCLAALLMLVFPSEFHRSFSWQQFLGSVTFSNQFFGFDLPIVVVGWTLNLEMIFYLLVGISLLIAPWLWMRYFIAAIGVYLTVLYGFADPVVFEFLFGFVVFMIYKKVKQSLLVGSLSMALSILGFILWFVGTKDVMPRWIHFGVPAFFLVLAAVSLPQINSGLIRKLGFASFSVYLTQWFTIPVFLRLVPAAQHSDLLVLLTLSISFAAVLMIGIFYSEFVDRRLYLGARKLFGLVYRSR